MNGIISADIGGTNIRIGLFNTDGIIVDKKSTFTFAQKGPHQAMDRLLDLAIELLNGHPNIDVKSIALSLAGPVDKYSKKLISPPNLPGWNNISPEILLKEILIQSHISILNNDLEIFSQNDVNLAVFGEYEYGIGKIYNNIIFLSWGTGIGGGIIIDGKLMIGKNGFAGEIGHILIDPSGPLCNCGLFGCLESFVSGSALVKLAMDHINKGKHSLLKDIYTNNNNQLSGEDIVHADFSGDILAKELLDNAAWNMGKGISTLKHIFDPDIFIIGGGLSDIFHRLYPIISESVSANSMEFNSKETLIIPSLLGSDASLYGAARLAILNGNLIISHHDLV
ncbi:MAG: hypothetical protein CL785_01755 [Chloroflexi bacterium]|nr:hypothetical protein [Chloroflexota bacterium]|tara:strand:+ start:8498 stop:9511 length:1014 start_codon:yes stop_codon:yes gene_type:complete